jgi:hypothetical protein
MRGIDRPISLLRSPAITTTQSWDSVQPVDDRDPLGDGSQPRTLRGLFEPQIDRFLDPKGGVLFKLLDRFPFVQP